jgi:hypothetical protein
MIRLGEGPGSGARVGRRGHVAAAPAAADRSQAEAKLVGLVFDGNWESVSSNWVYNPDLTRAIHVAIRYLLWVMDEVDQAERLIREMGLEPAD